MKIFLTRFGSVEHAKVVADRLKREGVSGRSSIILSSSYPSATMFTKMLGLCLEALVELSDTLRIERPDYVQNDNEAASVILKQCSDHGKDIVVVVHEEQIFSLPLALAEWQQEVVVSSQNQIIQIDLKGRTINLLPLRAA